MKSPPLVRRSRSAPTAKRPPPQARRAPGRAGPLADPALIGPQQLVQLQAGAGNAAVVSLLADYRSGRPLDSAQRRVDPNAPPVPPPRTLPHEDPRFTAVRDKAKGAGATLKKHPKAGTEVNQARAAAEPPANDVDAQAKADKVAEMGEAKPGTFDKAKFVAAVRKAIEANSPKTLEDADNHAKSGKAEQVKNQVMGEVGKGKDGTTADIKNTTASPPDPSNAKVKPVTPMPVPGAVPTPAVNGAKAMPAPVPPEQLNLNAEKHETAATMAEAGVTEQTLANSNEPQFKDALAAKQAGEAHSASAPGEVKAMEQSTLAGAQAGAGGSATSAIATMVAAKAGGTAKLGDSKSDAKSKEETERKNVATQIDNIFQATKTETEAILKGVDEQVNTEFSKGEGEARAAFEAHHTSKMNAWKDKRYAGGLNWTQWLIDKVMDLPPEVNQFVVEARELYIKKMDVVISNVADLIGRELTRARDRIAKGRADVKAFVNSQPANLKKYAAEAEQKIAGQFEQLDQSVDDKQEGLVDDLATKYTEARTAVDERVEQVQSESKGLWSMAKSAVGEAVETVKKMKGLLMTMFARVASAVDRIIQDPIGFLGKFVNAVKAGLDRFVGNIKTHLKKGLQGWLFGALADAGIEIPETFDFKGILKLVLSVLGATWQALRALIVKRIGEPVMAKIEKAVDFVKVLITEGPAGLWKMFLEKLGDIKSMIMSQIQSFIITRVIVAGITWLIGMLNPASAFVKACKAIVDVVNFFVEKGEAIKGVIDSAVDSVEEVLAGGVGKVAGMIEDALAKVVPVLIGLLASLLGLGGISDKIQKILETLRKPVNKAMDFVVGKVVKLGKGLLKKLKNSKLGRSVRKAKAKIKRAIAKGKAWVKKKVAKAKAWVAKKVYGGTPEEREKKGLAEAVNAVNKYAGKPVAGRILQPRLSFIRMRRGLSQLNLRPVDDRWHLDAIVQRNASAPTAALAVVAQLPGHAKDAAGAILPGVTGAYQAIKNRSDPRKKQHPELVLEAEHVIRRQFQDELFKAAELPGVPPSGAAYGDQTTVLIYSGAARDKTNKFELAYLPDVRKAASSAKTHASDAKDLQSRLANVLKEIRREAVRMTNKYITDEDSGKRAARGNDSVLPTPSAVQDAAETQLGQAIHLLDQQINMGTSRRSLGAGILARALIDANPNHRADLFVDRFHGPEVATVTFRLVKVFPRTATEGRSEKERKVVVEFTGSAGGDVTWQLRAISSGVSLSGQATPATNPLIGSTLGQIYASITKT